MSILFEERTSESPYLESVLVGCTANDGETVRPSEVHWHMVFSNYEGRMYPIYVGPWTSSGVVRYGEGAEILWIKFSLGTFMPHLSPRDFRDAETTLPGAARQAFWLKGSAWQFPNYDNVEAFIDRLVRAEVLVRDPLVKDVLLGYQPDLASRTVRHRFLQATGLTQLHIHQAERAQRAEALLRQGVPILDTVFELGYYDQPHITRALKQYIGHTPGQIAKMGG